MTKRGVCMELCGGGGGGGNVGVPGGDGLSIENKRVQTFSQTKRPENA